jgi:hypothetical protein
MIKDRYRYPIFASGMLIMILAAMLYKYAGFSLDIGEITVAIGACLFVISMVPRIRKGEV